VEILIHEVLLADFFARHLEWSVPSSGHWGLKHRASTTQQISYEQHVPLSVRQRMPPEAKSCFFGVFQLKASEERLALHLYDRNGKTAAKERLPATASYEERLTLVPFDFTVDLFEVKQRRGNGTGSYRFITTFPLNIASRNI
jgi:hypothetical protein